MNEIQKTKNQVFYIGLIALVGIYIGLYLESKTRTTLFIIFSAITYFGWLFLRPNPRLHPSFPLEFADHPEKFNDQCITIEGRVVKIFSDTVGEGLKRKLIDIFRTMIGSHNYEGRYSHLRFLIEAPKLHGRILVEHNLKYGRPGLHYGSIVELKGEYIHPEKSRSKNFYGKIHYTHEPKGYLKKL